MTERERGEGKSLEKYIKEDLRADGYEGKDLELKYKEILGELPRVVEYMKKEKRIVETEG